jgi:chaperone BCS1
MNYPYKYSALIHGVPGSGKTSTILAIASELKRDVEYVNLSAVSAVDLLDRMNGHPGRIFVFEDIDAIKFSANSNRNDDSESAPSETDDEGTAIPNSDFSGTLSLSDLLNITDGLLSSDGTICIFTTNHKDRLDPAFLRAGRMNKTIEFRYMSPETSARMVRHHLGVTVSGFRDSIKPAELQEMILDIKAGKKILDDMKKEFFKVSVDNISGI